MTLSIAGRVRRNRPVRRRHLLVVAGRRGALRVGARGVGAACTQNITDPRLGTVLLDRMGKGDSASAAMAAVVGRGAAHRLATTHCDRSIRRDRDLVRRAHPRRAMPPRRVLTASRPAISSPTSGSRRRWSAPLPVFPKQSSADRLVAALTAGLRAGGEAGPVHSAGLVIVSDVPWPVTDLRVDWSEDPVAELSALWRLWRPQADAYRLRALDPAAAPSYGVPGDEDRA